MKTKYDKWKKNKGWWIEKQFQFYKLFLIKQIIKKT